jgi:hypothetical protein
MVVVGGSIPLAPTIPPELKRSKHLRLDMVQPRNRLGLARFPSPDNAVHQVEALREGNDGVGCTGSSQSLLRTLEIAYPAPQPNEDRDAGIHRAYSLANSPCRGDRFRW